MLKKLSEKLRAKCPATTPGYSMLKIVCLDDAFLEVFQPQASPVEGQSLQQKEKKRRKRKGEKKIPKIEKPKDIGHFLVSKFVARKASCCVADAFFDRIKANMTEIQPKNHQNVLKMHFL